MDRPFSNRSNPSSRNSESKSNVRRSFSGGNPFGGRPSGLTNPRLPNPITPANSPADHLRRQSLGKEGSGVNPRVSDEKENEKAARVRIPAKGSKHFMSPTISASSKFTPSPRKKVLAERNEIVRTSIQFSDFQEPDLMEDSCVKPEKKLDQVMALGSFDSNVDQKEVIVEVPSVPQVTLDSEMTENSDCVSCTEKSVSFSDNSPIIAPLDADPSQPPYDPKTNFLSPRPQFLHYRPNPRIEVFLYKENGAEFGECGGMRLEDSFTISEESQSEDSQKESDDLSLSETISEGEGEPIVSEPKFITSEESQSEDSLSEDLALSETILEEEGESIISEPIPIRTPTPAYEAKRSPKPRFFKRTVSIYFIMAFLIACVSLFVTDYPVLDSSVLKDCSLSKLYDSSEVAAFAKSNLDELARIFRQWSENFVSYLPGLAPDYSQSNEFGSIQFVNLTYVPPQEDLLVDRYIGVNFGNYEVEESQEEEEEWEMVSEEKDEDEVENVISVEDQSVQEPEAAEILAETESVDVKPEADLPEFKSEQEVEIAPLEPLQSTAEDTNVELPSKIAPLEPEPETIPSLPNAVTYKLSPQNMLGVSLLAFSLAAATIFLYQRQRKSGTPSDVTQELPKEPVVSSKQENWEAKVDEVAEESCPSEMSSFQKSSSYTKRVYRETNEAQSHEKRPRTNYKRESLASSSSEFSMGSLSYGSFTTYERIPIKKATGEEEIVTPVRRSSRIRSHVTSSS